MPEQYEIIYQENASVEEEEALFEGVIQSAVAAKGMSRMRPFAFFIKDSEKVVLAGVKGVSLYGCLYVDIPASDDSLGKHTNSGTPFIDREARFHAHIERRIFKRAGMEGALRESGRLVDGVYPPARHQPDCFEIPSEGPKKGAPQKVDPVEFPEPYPHGNGCWRMTTNDLFDFSRAIQHNLLISAKSFQDMQDRHLGFGVERDQNEAIIGYGHPGGGPGMSSFLHIWRTDPPVTAVVLSNHSGCEMVKPCLDPLMQQ